MRDRPPEWFLIENQTVRSLRTALSVLPFADVADLIDELDCLEPAMFPEDVSLWTAEEKLAALDAKAEAFVQNRKSEIEKFVEAGEAAAADRNA